MRSAKPQKTKGPWPAVVQVNKFLKTYPEGHLIVVTGYVSASGLAWLAERADGRRVSLVIGDVEKSQIRYSGTPVKRNKAVRFLKRADVRAFTWKHEQPGQSPDIICHAKLWAVTEGQMLKAALVGSANLTHSGMNLHFEIMVPAADRWLTHLSNQMAWLLQNSVPANAALIKELSGAAKKRPGGKRRG